ncbi:TlpA family protein disulfide reductase [Pinibacter aurantiacus]|uniref:TlpA family protein disulfide reductase n=1 Tax=Pinibacter aurantiacus TaxID=2851599 RepID=A0A9E2W613_9BACT|nr:TlpA disulfide reductase family protein [Pinibacter aurantiacus]MBV4359539.1 TlpA family protein disulfide reductase [Pinibacter aurantiacus]
MLGRKVFSLSVLALLSSTGVLRAQTAVDSASQVEARKTKYLSGLQKVNSDKELHYADSVSNVKGVSEADIICLSQDFQKVHRYEFKNRLDQSDYKLTTDTYVDSSFVVRLKVARIATKEEQEKAIEEFRKLVFAKTPESIEREKIIASQMNKPAPLFSVTDVDGVKYDLHELKGKVVVLNFWFIGCAPCKKEMPELNKLVEKYKAKDVVFLAFEVNDNSAEKIKAVTSGNFNYTMIPAKRNGISIQYNIKTYPTSYVIDQSGIIRFGLAAYNPFRLPEMDKTIETLLNH